jgi:hypothetical protein
MDSCRGGKVRMGTIVRLRRGGDAAWQGEVEVLSHRCSLLLGGAPVATAMKGPRRLHRRRPGTG